MKATTNILWEQKRVRGKRGRGAGKSISIEVTPVFGMLKREGKVYTQVVKNCSASALIPIIREHSSIQVFKIQQFLVILGGLMVV